MKSKSQCISNVSLDKKQTKKLHNTKINRSFGEVVHQLTKCSEQNKKQHARK